MVFRNVKAYCEKNNMSISAFEKMCEIGNGTVGRWESDKSQPALQTLSKIEKATGISIASWLADEKG